MLSPIVVRVRDQLVDRLEPRVYHAMSQRLRDELDAHPDAAMIRRIVNDARLYDHLVWGDRSRLKVDPTARLNNALLNVGGGTIEVQAYAFLGNNVSVLAGKHDATKFGAERRDEFALTGHDIVLESGVWVGSGAIILGPCRVGADAVVAAGSVVRGDVPARTIVAGNPAVVVRRINDAASLGGR